MKGALNDVEPSDDERTISATQSKDGESYVEPPTGKGHQESRTRLKKIKRRTDAQEFTDEDDQELTTSSKKRNRKNGW